jgi:peptidoglycan hydrolase-like protein with peptidoglycan-binding domain
LQEQLDEQAADEDEMATSSDEEGREYEDEDGSDDDEDEADEEKESEDDDESAEDGPSDRALSMMPDFVRQRLQYGERNEAVRQLQELLAQSSEIYPEGLTTGYYGNLTKQAVARLQNRLDMQADGSEVGSSTFMQIRELVKNGTGNSGIIPPGLLRSAPAQRWLSSAATSTATSSTDPASTSSDATTTRPQRGPDVDRLPIDNKLKDQLRNILNDMAGQEGMNGQGSGQGGGPPANRGPFGSPPGNR